MLSNFEQITELRTTFSQLQFIELEEWEAQIKRKNETTSFTYWRNTPWKLPLTQKKFKFRVLSYKKIVLILFLSRKRNQFRKSLFP